MLEHELGLLLLEVAMVLQIAAHKWLLLLLVARRRVLEEAIHVLIEVVVWQIHHDLLRLRGRRVFRQEAAIGLLGRPLLLRLGGA